MTLENISRLNLYERMLPTQLDSNPQSSDHQSDVHQTEQLRLALVCASVVLYVAFVLICASSLLLLVPREGCAL